MVLNSFHFCLSGKLLISLLNLKKGLAGQSILSCRFFPFITLNIPYPSLLACRVSVENSADSLMGVSLAVICCFSVVAFNILSVFNFLSVWLLCVSVCSFLGLSCLGLSVLPGLGWLFPFPCLRSFQLLSLQIFSQVLSLFFWDPSNANVGVFNVVLRSLRLSSFFSFFFLYSILQQWLPPFCPPSFICSASVILLWIPSRILLFSVYS